MAPRLSGQTSIFGVVFFVSKSLLGIEGQKKENLLYFHDQGALSQQIRQMTKENQEQM